MVQKAGIDLIVWYYTIRALVKRIFSRSEVEYASNPNTVAGRDDCTLIEIE